MYLVSFGRGTLGVSQNIGIRGQHVYLYRPDMPLTISRSVRISTIIRSINSDNGAWYTKTSGERLILNSDSSKFWVYKRRKVTL